MRETDLQTMPNDAQYGGESSIRSMSIRLPRPMHEAMKILAADRNMKAADFYVQSIADFISEHMSRYRHLFAIENDAVHVSIQVPVRFTNEVRDAAAQRRVTANELIFTAVSHVLEVENAQAA